ncbi:MAG TPA: DUF4097 family beta strand repeat-containing protein [Methylomusa anaerophila]|uniref:DUF4097 domain-containing protein n=1 Tax=Methylomusa anaerophila TaxID=1930071 RepID=A0A348ALQ8_9FIRM|nr:DUF4097 family beta strand repeat-containing protein [Methylomusa anaerophila]BBB92006.1 hypothetical protein MAMMFC1_02691 [Methylomusa anaerophila]HML87982.1 DUF4097 family beta strand repeat-containing protein [Methylomusa anaerophila]
MDGILKKAAIGAFLLFLLGVAGNGVLFAMGLWNGGGYRELSDTYVIKATEYKSIDLKIIAGDVRVVGGDVDRPTVRIWRWTAEKSLRPEEVISEAVQGDVLHLKIEDGGRIYSPLWFMLFPGNKERNNHFEVMLPRTEYETLVITTGLGRVQGENLAAGILTARMNSGQFKLENCRAGEISLTADSGSFDMIDCRATKITSRVSSGRGRFENIKGKIDIVSNSGHFDVVMDEILDDVLIRINSGFADIKIGQARTPFRLEATASAGQLDIDLPQARPRVHTRSFQGRIGQGEGPLVKVEIDSGRAKIW